MNPSPKDKQFCSTLIVLFSTPLHQSKKLAFTKIKAKYLSHKIKKNQIISNSFNKEHSSRSSYLSITDFKPIDNNYSSVKIFEDDSMNFDNFQTKKQEIHKRMEQDEEKLGMKQLQHWMIFQKAKQIRPQNYPKAEYCSKKNALEIIKSNKFEVFSKTVLRKKKNWFYEDKDALVYKNSMIKNSLTDMSDEKAEEAIDLFQMMLMAGGDMRDEGSWIYHLWKLVSWLQNGDESLIEEGYFQILKQIQSKKICYLRIFCCFCTFIKPSARMYVPILNYIYIQDLTFPELSQHFSYCFFNLIKSFHEPHMNVPSMFDLFCTAQMRKIPITISFPKERIFFMETYSKVEELLQQLMKFYGLDESVSYLINVQGVLMEKGYILDTVNRSTIFENEEEEVQSNSWTKFNQFNGYKGLLVLKNMAIFQKSIGTFLIMFNHLIQQFRKGLFALTPTQIVQIGSLLIHSEMQTQQCFQFCLARYIPKKYTRGAYNEELIKLRSNILRSYYSYCGDRIGARKSIVNILRSSKVFLTHFFYGNYFVNDDEEVSAFLGIQPGIILIIEPRNGRVMMKIEFEKIQKWGSSKSQICLKVLKMGQVHFQCKGIDLLVSIYCEYLAYFSAQLQKSLNKKQ